MGTIKSVLDYYKEDGVKITVENAFGKELMDEVKAVGGELIIDKENGTYHFENVGEELQAKLKSKIVEIKKSKDGN